MSNQRGATWLAPVLTLALAILVIAPVAMVAVTVMRETGDFGWSALRRVLTSTRTIGNTLMVAFGSTVVALLVGGSLAFALVRTNVPGRALLERLVVIPLYVTGLLTAIGWTWLGSPRAGLINLTARQIFGLTEPLFNIQSPGGVIFVAAMNAAPVPFLMISGALRAMDPSLEESARIGGASVRASWRYVTLPLILPAVTASAMLVFVNGMGLFAIPAILGLPADFYVAGTEIYTSLTTYPQRIGNAAAWGLLLLAATALLVWLQALLLNRRSFVTVTGKAFRPRVIELGVSRYVLAAAVWTYLALGVFLPVLAILWASLINFLTVNPKLMSFGLNHFHYVLFEYPKTYLATTNSLVLALLAATIVCILGLMIGWLQVRGQSRLRLAVDMLAMAPIAIPSLTFALGLLWLYVGVRWLPIYGTIFILLLAYVTHFLPFGVRAGNSALRQLHPELEEAARIGGARWGQIIRYVTFPLTRPTLSAAWILVFVLSMQEVSASMLLYSNRSLVLSVAVFGLWEQGNIGGLAALSILQLVFMFAVVGLLIRSRHREIV